MNWRTAHGLVIRAPRRVSRSCRLQFETLEDRRVMANVPVGFTETVVASNMTSPITMDIDEDGRIWVAFQDGRLGVIENGASVPQLAFELDADGSGERGFQGIELDPHFAHNGYIYVYYTAARNQAGQLASHNRLSRLTVDPLTENSIIAGSEVILLELPEFSTFPTNQSPIWHMGGAIHFLPDETIVIQVGDHLNNSIVQNNNTPLGKVLRVNKDGTPATNNPFYNPADTNPAGGSDWNGNAPGDTDWIDYVWASGLRNPFSGDVDPATGRYYVNDVGEVTWEEINDATVAGRNFGWPTTEGTFNPASFPNFANPVLAYNHGNDCAITGGAFYSPSFLQFPAQYEGMYFYSQFCSGQIRYIDPDNPGTSNSFITGAAYPMNIEIGPDGSLYYIARGAGAGGAPGIGTGQILKVQNAASIAPQIVSHPTNQLTSVGYNATFTASAAGTPTLAYQWQRQNGSIFVDIPDATSSTLTRSAVSLADDGAQFRVVVTNGFGSATSNLAVLDVTSDTPPTPEILLPAAGATYRAGDTISFSGAAADLEDGSLAAAAMTWQIDFHHGTHSHPFYPATSGISGGQFTIPTNSETAANVWFRIQLSVTDSAGLTTNIFRDVHPVTSEFTVEANIDGAQILVDGQPKSTPLPITGVVNVTRSLEAPALVSANGQFGQFVQWLDGETDRFREISTPEEDTAYVALYENILTSLVFLSNLAPSNNPPPNGWGPIEYDTSNGEAALGDGIPMSVGGVLYSKGLGVHAASDVRYQLGGAFSRFIADVGVDDETGSGGSVVFQVYGDGVLLTDSGTRVGSNTSTGQPLRIDVNVAGVNELRLVVTDNGDGNGSDHADWGNARLIPTGAGANTYVNFQTIPDADTPVPSGYVADTGLVFGPRSGGLSYGWSTAVTTQDRNANSANDLYQTHAEIPSNQSRAWEIQLPNGTYAVTVAVGDAGGTANDTNNSVTVEGVSYWNSLALQNDVFTQQTRLITVSDGRLTMNVGSGSATLPAAVNFIEIVPVPTTDPGTGLFPFFAADVNLNGKLTLQDALEFAAGWGIHDPGLNFQQRVRLGDLDFDGDTDNDDWNVFHAQWVEEGNSGISRAALLAPIAGDFDRSGTVDTLDYATWKATFGSSDEMTADGNGDGVVDAADFTLWRNNLGNTIGAPSLNAVVLIIDPNTGVSEIKNDRATSIAIDGYSIISTGTALQPADGFWYSLEDQGLIGWEEALPTGGQLSELTTGASLQLVAGGLQSLGDVFNTSLPATGISFEFTSPGDPTVRAGIVVFGELGGEAAAGDASGSGTLATAEFGTSELATPLQSIAQRQLAIDYALAALFGGPIAKTGEHASVLTNKFTDAPPKTLDILSTWISARRSYAAHDRGRAGDGNIEDASQPTGEQPSIKSVSTALTKRDRHRPKFAASAFAG